MEVLRAEPDFEQEYPGAAKSASLCYINIVRTADRLTAELSRRLRADAGLSLTAVMVLATLDGLGGATTPGTIAEHIIVSSASVTSLLDTLQKRGLAIRSPHGQDRRRVEVRITAAGQELIDRVLPGLHQIERRVMRGLDETDRAELLRMLAVVQTGVAGLGAEPTAPLQGARHQPRRLDPH